MTQQSDTEQPDQAVTEPIADPMEWIRVKDLDTGNVTSIRRMSFPHGNYEIVDVEPALAGEKLADEPNPAAAADEPTEPDWIRVKDLDTGHELSIHRMSLPHGNYEVLQEDAVDAVTGEVVDGEHNPAAPSAEHADVDYDQLVKADLEAEVERRNEGRLDSDSLIAVGGRGNKPDLVAALVADDQAQAAAAAANSLPGPTPDGETPVDTSGGQ